MQFVFYSYEFCVIAQAFGRFFVCRNYIKQSLNIKFFALYSHLYNFNWLNYTVHQNVILLHISTHNLFLPVGRTRHSFSMKLLSNKLLVKQKSVCWYIFSKYICYLFFAIACFIELFGDWYKFFFNHYVIFHKYHLLILSILMTKYLE